MSIYRQESEYCHKGHPWIFIDASVLYGQYFYCKECDKLYRLHPVEITREEVNKGFNTERYNEMVSMAKLKEFKKSITKEECLAIHEMRKKSHQ